MPLADKALSSLMLSHAAHKSHVINTSAQPIHNATFIIVGPAYLTCSSGPELQRLATLHD